MIKLAIKPFGVNVMCATDGCKNRAAWIMGNEGMLRNSGHSICDSCKVEYTRVFAEAAEKDITPVMETQTDTTPEAKATANISDFAIMTGVTPAAAGIETVEKDVLPVDYSTLTRGELIDLAAGRIEGKVATMKSADIIEKLKEQDEAK